MNDDNKVVVRCENCGEDITNNDNVWAKDGNFYCDGDCCARHLGAEEKDMFYVQGWLSQE